MAGAEEIEQVAIPDDNPSVFVPPAHSIGAEEPLTAKVTAPVGVPELPGDPLTLAETDTPEPESA